MLLQDLLIRHTTIHISMKKKLSSILKIYRHFSQHTQQPPPLNERQWQARWFDTSAVKTNGQAYFTDTRLAPPLYASYFPPVTLYTLTNQKKTYPDDINTKIKIIVFSFKELGGSVLQSWKDSYHTQLPTLSYYKDIQLIELYCIEYSFLYYLKSIFINHVKNNTLTELHPYTGFTFGHAQKFAKTVNAPNRYCGYVYVLDKYNRIRWRASGLASTEDLKKCYEILDELYHEKDTPPS